jgi:hypothetical protein
MKIVSPTSMMFFVYYESIKREPKIRGINKCRCDERLQTKTKMLLFIIRVKRELKRVYRNGCRYNERLNAETGGSKTPRTQMLFIMNRESES